VRTFGHRGTREDSKDQERLPLCRAKKDSRSWISGRSFHSSGLRSGGPPWKAATNDTAAVFLIAFDATITVALEFGKSDRTQEGLSLRELAFAFAMFGQHALAAELLARVLHIANANGIAEILEPKVTLHITCDGRVGIGLDMSALEHDAQTKRPRMAARIGRMNMLG
jgi:hypothetical protein